jgi:hypothetical protein
MKILLLKLLLAHVLGDFVFQTRHWVNQKVKKSYRSRFLYFHVAIHFGLLALFLGLNIYYAWGIAIIVISHFCIDLLKIYLTKKVKAVALFIADQAAHLLVLLGVAWYYKGSTIKIDLLLGEKTLSLSLALIALTFVSAVVMQVIMSQWQFKEDKENESLPKAGFYIGVLERLFVFGFIVLNQWQAIGLLITAKSVFRFGDLSKAKDRKLTEYVLIGTLLSFGLATAIGLAYKAL